MDYAERREYERIRPRAYGVDTACTVVVAGATVTGELIDISAGGARLKLPGCTAATGQAVTLTVQCGTETLALRGLAGDIRWVSAPEVGVRFNERLELGVTALQKLVG